MSTHRTRRSIAAVAACGALALTGALAACSSDDDLGPTTSAEGDVPASSTTEQGAPDTRVSVVDVWTEPNTDVGGTAKVYATIVGGPEDDVLTGVTVDAELAGGARLTPDSTVEIPATTTVNLDESGTHVELTDLTAALEYDHPFHVTFEFENSDPVHVEGVVTDPDHPEDDGEQ